MTWETVLIGLVGGLIVAAWWFFHRWFEWQPLVVNGVLSLGLFVVGHLLGSSTIFWSAVVLAVLGTLGPPALFFGILGFWAYQIGKGGSDMDMAT